MTTLGRQFTVALLLLFGLMAGFTGGADAQNDIENSISLRVSNCPPGMSADDFDTDDCEPVTDGFDVRIDSLAGVMAPFTLADATLDGNTFVWNNEEIDNRGAFGPLSIRMTLLPEGFSDYIVEGTGVDQASPGYWTFLVTSENPTPFLSIYNFASESAPDGAPTVTPAASSTPDIEAAIAASVCGELEEASDIRLESPVLAAGDAEGSAKAVPVAVSYSTVDISLDEMLEREHAIVIRGSDKDEILACGEIGGVRQSDGALAVGLSDAGSGVSGVAYLAPLSDDSDQTGISLFVIVPSGESG
jgi:hypothetical protein